MKKKMIATWMMCMMSMTIVGCGQENNTDSKAETATVVATVESVADISTDETDISVEETQEEMTTEETTESVLETEETSTGEVLADGIYQVTFDTDSSMFHVNEACNGKGTLTVVDGQMTIHIVMPSKNVLNLYLGMAEDAQAEGAEWIEPTVEEVTYEDGLTEEVFAFDVPVPVIGEEFDLALIGKKEVWYDHKVSVSNPEPVEE